MQQVHSGCTTRCTTSVTTVARANVHHNCTKLYFCILRCTLIVHLLYNKITAHVLPGYIRCTLKLPKMYISIATRCTRELHRVVLKLYIRCASKVSSNCRVVHQVYLRIIYELHFVAHQGVHLDVHHMHIKCTFRLFL